MEKTQNNKNNKTNFKFLKFFSNFDLNLKHKFKF